MIRIMVRFPRVLANFNWAIFGTVMLGCAIWYALYVVLSAWMG